MQNQQVGSTVNPMQVRQIIAVTASWIHVLGSDRSHYLLPAVPQSYSHEHAYADSVFLKSLGISTLGAAVLVLTNDLALESGLAADENPHSTQTTSIGWCLPQEVGNGRLMQILPSSWLPRITNREQFLEVLILDTWFRRPGRREVIFKQSGRDIQSFFLPSGRKNDSPQASTIWPAYQKDVYNGLGWAKIQSALKAKLTSLNLASLEKASDDLPRIGADNEILRTIWSDIMVNKVSFDQTLSAVREQIFGRVGYTNEERTIQVRADRVRVLRGAGAGRPLGSGCG